MDDKQHQELEDRLAQRARELQEAIEGLRSEIASAPRGDRVEVLDAGEDGDARAQAATDLAHLARQEDALREVLAARDRMRQGRYGRCETCDEDIPFERLRARPEARFCLRHEEEWEKAHPVRLPSA